MADIKISALPAATTVSDADIVVINQGGVTKTAARSLVKGGSGTVTSVTGGTGLTGGTITSTGTLAVAYGTTSGTAAQGNDARLSDARTPTAHKSTHATGGSDALAPSDIGAVSTARTITAGTGLTGGGDLSADRTLSVSYGTAPGTAAQGNDARLSDARTPTTHASTHGSGGSDPITVSTSQISGTLDVAKGGTGQTFYGLGQLLIGNASSGLSKGSIIGGSGITVTPGDGSVTIAATGGGSGVSSFSAGTTGLTPNTASTGAVTLAGTLAIANGGTGATTQSAALSALGALSATASAGGDLTGNYPNPTFTAITTAQSNVGSSTQIPVLSIDAKGRVTALSSVTAAGGGIPATDVQTFTSSGTWTKPAGAVSVHIVAIGGGGGGGSGRKSSNLTTAHCGGGGGAGAGYTERLIPAALLGATETITVGAGGTGGPAVTTDNTSGQNGGVGGNTSFGTWVIAFAGTQAIGGTIAAGTGGSGSSTRSMFPGSTGGNSATAANAGAGVNVATGAGGGGAGGAVAITTGTFFNGGGGAISLGSFSTAGSTAGGSTDGGAGNNGPSVTAGWPLSGNGGGGGAGGGTVSGGAGGNGGSYGAGGGGGGATSTGAQSGKGGDGAQGIVVVTTYF